MTSKRKLSEFDAQLSHSIHSFSTGQKIKFFYCEK